MPGVLGSADLRERCARANVEGSMLRVVLIGIGRSVGIPGAGGLPVCMYGLIWKAGVGAGCAACNQGIEKSVGRAGVRGLSVGFCRTAAVGGKTNACLLARTITYCARGFSMQVSFTRAFAAPGLCCCLIDGK